MSIVRINPKEVELVLEGDLRALWGAFDFASTPQGLGYWSDRAIKKIPLSEEDRKILQRWLRVHNGQPDQDEEAGDQAPNPTFDKWDPKNWGL